MSFKFEFKIDYDKLTALLDNFLKSHSDELTSIMGKCLVLEPSSPPVTSTVTTTTPPSNTIPTSFPNPNLEPKPQPMVTTAATTMMDQAPDLVVDQRPLIGDTIPEDPLQNLFSNTSLNVTTTRYQDRNNPHIKKGFK